MDLEARDELGDDGHDAPPRGEAYGSAPVLALAALVLAVVSLLGFGLLNGSSYVPDAFSGPPEESSRALVAGLLGAGIALVPLLAGLTAAARASQDDPPWTPVVARAAVLVAATSVVTRVAVAIAQESAESGGFIRF